jgi:hypothetical protein
MIELNRFKSNGKERDATGKKKQKAEEGRSPSRKQLTTPNNDLFFRGSQQDTGLLVN